jgi:anti-anti-sigma factor
MARRTWDFRVRRERVENALVVSLEGRLGASSVHLLDSVLIGAEDVALVVDLAGLDYISGPGLSALDAASSRAAVEHRTFVICGLQEAVLTCFELSGLLSTLVVESDRKSALVRVSWVHHRLPDAETD